MELLYFYIIDDKRNIKGCEFNFSPSTENSTLPRPCVLSERFTSNNDPLMLIYCLKN